MKRKLIKLILIIAAAMTSFAVSGLTCLAAPAMPGVSGSKDGVCYSATAENPVNMEVLAERDRLISEKEKVMKISPAAAEPDAGILCVGDDDERLIVAAKRQ